MIWMQIRSAAWRTLFLALMAVAVALPLAAQPDGGFGPPQGGPPPEGMDQAVSSRGPSVEREMKQLTKQLSLTTDQQPKVKVVLTERSQKMAELMRSMRPGGGSQQQSQANNDSQQQDPPSAEQFEQMRTQMKAIRDDANTKIAALLSAEQATKFAALLKQRQSHGDDGMPPGPPLDGGMGGPPPEGGPGGGGPPGL
jgi:Spy/CpxP family protein refolding chaperone